MSQSKQELAEKLGCTTEEVEDHAIALLSWAVENLTERSMVAVLTPGEWGEQRPVATYRTTWMAAMQNDLAVSTPKANYVPANYFLKKFWDSILP